MIKKRLLYISLTALISCTAYGMSLVDDLKKNSGSPEEKSVEDTVVEFAQSPMGQGILQEVENKVTSLFSRSTATTSTTTTSSIAPSTTTRTIATPTTPTIVVSHPTAHTMMAHNNGTPNQVSALSQSSSRIGDSTENIPLSHGNQISHKNQVPQLNLKTPMRTASTSQLPPKTPVRNVSELKKNVTKVVHSARTSNQNSSNTPSVSSNPQDAVINMEGFRKRVVVDEEVSKFVLEGRVFTESEVWDIIQEIKPEVVQFAQEHGLSLDEAKLYGGLLKKFNVSPETVVEYINNNKPADKKTVIEAGKYKKIRQEDPDKYKEIILEILKDLAEEEDGQKTPSPLTNTHIDLLEDQVAGDQKTKRNLWIAIGVKAVLLIIGAGGTIWGIVNQTHLSSPTAAPTFAPTFEPTFAPI